MKPTMFSSRTLPMALGLAILAAGCKGEEKAKPAPPPPPPPPTSIPVERPQVVAPEKAARKERIGGNFHSSPIYAGGNIYFFDQTGKTTVIEAGPKYKLVAENQLDEGFQACPAVSVDALYLRTKTTIYCIKK